MAVTLKIGGSAFFDVNGKYYQKGQYDYTIVNGVFTVWNVVGNNKNAPIANAPIDEVLNGDDGNTPFTESTLKAWLAANFFLTSSGGGGGGGSVAWVDITGKPATFTPSTHSHAWGDVTGKPTTFAPSAHNHAASEITSGTLAAARLGAGTTTDGFVLSLVLGVPTWSISSGGGGTAWDVAGNATIGNKIFGQTGSGASRVDFRTGAEVFGTMGINASGQPYGAFGNKGSSFANWWNIAIGGEGHVLSGAGSVTLGGVGTKSQGTFSLGINGGAAEANYSIAVGSNTTYANGAYSTAWGGYANNNNFQGCFNISDYYMAVFNNNTHPHQFSARFTGGFQFKTENSLMSFELLPSGKVRLFNVPEYNSAPLADSSELPGTIYLINGSPVLQITS